MMQLHKSTLSPHDIESSLKVAYLYFSGMKQNQIAKQLRVTPSAVSRSLSKARQFVEVRFSVPGNEKLEAQLLMKYGRLVDAIAVETASSEQARAVVGHAAARYFMGNVSDGDTVAFSCGETLLEMVKALPAQPSLSLALSQLSIEGDPLSIHQAPSTLIGILKTKLSHKSRAIGIQLPPRGTVKGDTLFRENLETSPLMINMRKDARNSKFAFIGVGAISNGAVCAKSFAAIEDQKLRAELRKAIGEYSLVGEINNRLFDRLGRDCTARIKGFNSYFMNVLNLDELRDLVKKGSNVVLVATGLAKTEAIRVALQNGLANVVITDRQVAQRLIV